MGLLGQDCANHLILAGCERPPPARGRWSKSLSSNMPRSDKVTFGLITKREFALKFKKLLLLEKPVYKDSFL